MIRAKQSNSLGETLVSLKLKSTQVIMCRDIQPRDAFIVVMGPAGSGKSTFVNKCSGKDAVVVWHGLIPGILSYLTLHRLVPTRFQKHDRLLK